MEGGTVVKITEDGANVVLGAAGRSGGVVGKRGRVKGPNPLSVRKKKVGSGAVEVSGDKEVGKVKKRAREEEEMDKIGGTEADGSEGGGGVGVGKRKRKRKSRSKGGVEGAVTRPDDELSGEGSE